MKRLSLLSLLVLGVLVLMLAGRNVQTDGNGWRGVNRDGKVEGFKAPAVWPGQLTRLWQQTVGLGDASPVLVNNKLYLHVKQDSSEVVICVDAASGEKIWQHVCNAAPEVTGGAASHPGPRSTPCVAGGKVFAVGAGGILTCLDAQTGKLIWKNDSYTEVPPFFVAVSPLVADNKCIVHLGGNEHGTVVAFDVNTGKECWKLPGEAATYSSPVWMPAFNMIVVQSATNLLGISSDLGELLWKTATPPETRFYNSSTPLLQGDRIVVAGQGSGTRSFLVKKEGGRLVVTENWKNPDLGVSFNTPVLKNGYLYGNEARFGSLFCLNAETGEKCWADTVKNNRFASLLDLGEVMISLPANGQLIVFKPDHRALNQIVRYKVADTEVYAHPVVDGDKIFVKDKEMLTCWQIK